MAFIPRSSVCHLPVNCTDTRAQCAGRFYSETEFDLARIHALPSRIIEVGRTCVHPDYRTGAVINLLWSGLARFMVTHRFDHVIGCASIPLHGGVEHIGAFWHGLTTTQLSPPEWRVFPRTPFTSLPQPAPTTLKSVPPQACSSASAICERAEFPVQRNKTRIG